MRAKEIALYFLNKDKDKSLFTTDLASNNGRTFYCGNVRLNKYLHLSQNVYIALTGTKLFDDDLYAWDNGAVIPSVSNNFIALRGNCHKAQIIDNSDVAVFLDKMFNLLKNASNEDLIELSHEDEAWQEKCNNYYLNEEKMDSMKFKEVYKKQYSDVLKLMEKM